MCAAADHALIAHTDHYGTTELDFTDPCLQAAAREHWLRRLVLHWRQAAQECRQERVATMRAAFCSQKLLLRLGWRAWRQAVLEKRHSRQAKQLAEQRSRCRLLARSWSGWLEWTGLCRGARQRQAARTQASVFSAWRSAAKAAEKRCARLCPPTGISACQASKDPSGCLLLWYLNNIFLGTCAALQAAG